MNYAGKKALLSSSTKICRKSSLICLSKAGESNGKDNRDECALA